MEINNEAHENEELASHDDVLMTYINQQNRRWTLSATSKASKQLFLADIE